MKALCCIALFCCTAFSYGTAASVHHFSLKTTERLGQELYERTQQDAPLSEAQRGAKRAAMDALHQLDKSYRFVVLNNPGGSGYLVYALATSRNPVNIVLGLHYRVSVSAQDKVERIEPLGLGPLVEPGDGSDLPVGTHHVGFYCSCMVSTQPLETHVYLTLLHKQPCVVKTSDGADWYVEKGKITKNGNAR
jgi:hypothetical protein